MAKRRRIGGILTRALTTAVLVVGGVVLAEAANAQQFVYPISGPLTSTFYSSRSYGYHRALDIAGANRGSVGAARAGRVSYRGYNGGYGNLVIVDHGSGYTTYYAHMSSFAVSNGQSVSRGQTLGYEGSTGNSTGPHVHFEIRRYGSKQYMPGSYGNRVTKGAGISHTYPGLSGSAPPSSSPPSSSGGTGLLARRVTAGALNVRSGPSTGYRILGSVRRNQVYVSTVRSGSWHKIWFDGREAWCHGSYLASSSAQKRQVTTGSLNVRSGPSTGDRRVGSTPRGSVYARNSSSGSWIKIHYGGTTRWLHGGYTRVR
jgi:uncharacterized protein YraI